LAQSKSIGLVVQQANDFSVKISNFESFLKASEEKVNSSIEAVTRRLSDIQQKLANAEQELKDIRERQQALQPRTLSKAQREQFLAMLNRGPKGVVDVTAVMGDGEARGFAGELDQLLKAAGWTTGDVSQALFSGRSVGIQVRVHNPNSVPSHFPVLVHAFQIIGIEIHGTFNPSDVSEGAVRHIIGHKP